MQLSKCRNARLILSILFAALCTTSSNAEVTSPMQGAPVYNFENHLADWTCFSHTFKEDGYKIGVDPKVTFQNKPSAYLESTQPEQNGDFYVGISKSFKPGEFKGKRVEFSGYVKTKDLKGWAGLLMKSNADEDVLAFDNMQNRPIKDTNDWKRFSVVLDIPEQSTKLTVGLYLSGGGKVWLNGLSILPVKKSVPVTTQAWDAKKFSDFADETRKQPENIDFSRIAQERGGCL